MCPKLDYIKSAMCFFSPLIEKINKLLVLCVYYINDFKYDN